VAVELTLAAAKELHGALARAIAAAEEVEGSRFRGASFVILILARRMERRAPLPVCRSSRGKAAAWMTPRS
jgi:hypothetical protein